MTYDNHKNYNRYSYKNKKDVSSLVLRFIVQAAAFVTISILVVIIAFILIKGIPNISRELFEWEYTIGNVSMMPSIINTMLMTLLTLLAAVPIGVGCAVYLAEYAKKGSRLVKLIRLTTQTLTGIPSIVYGLFGYLLFVITLKWGYSLLAGAFTLAIMVLPVIVCTTEEALLSVPDTFREGSFGLGAGRVRTIFRVVMPSAVPGILGGIILAVGRIVGETAALIFTAGTTAAVPGNLFSSARTLAVHMYCLLGEGFYTNQAYATAVILLVVVLGINGFAGWAAGKLKAK